MKNSFDNLVDDVRNLSLDEKIEIKLILNKSIIEDKRKKILSNYQKSKKEFKENKLTFSNDIKKLNKILNNG
jgi:hypothetical protein